MKNNKCAKFELVYSGCSAENEKQVIKCKYYKALDGYINQCSFRMRMCLYLVADKKPHETENFICSCPDAITEAEHGND